MATKRKFPPKSGGAEDPQHASDTMSEAYETSPSKAKRRKNEKNMHILQNQDCADSHVKFYHLARDQSKQVCCSKQSEMDQCKNIFSKSGASSSERTTIKKPSLSVIRSLLMPQQKKAKINLPSGNRISCKVKKDVKCKKTMKNCKEASGRLRVSELADKLLLVDKSIKITKVEGKEKQMYDASQVVHSNYLYETDKEIKSYNQSSNLRNTKIPNNKTKRNGCPLITEEQTSPKDNSYASGSKSLNRTVSCVSHSHNPVQKAMTRVTTSVPSLSGSTSSITSIFTPIPSIPTLCDSFNDTFMCTLGSPEQVSVTSVRENNKCTNISSQKKEETVSTCDSEAERHEQSCVSSHHSKEINFWGKYENQSRKNPFLKAAVSTMNGTSSVKEGNSDGHADDIPGSKTDIHPLKVEQQSLLKVDGWGEHMLKNLEQLYKNKKQCDFALRFHDGEVLKVHRTVLLACTSAISGADAVEGESELHMPADLNYASVEPVIRFVYSGLLEIKQSDIEMTAIYTAAKRLKVPLLIQIMEHHYPSLFQPHLNRGRNAAEEVKVTETEPRKNLKKCYLKKARKAPKSCSTSHISLSLAPEVSSPLPFQPHSSFSTSLDSMDTDICSLTSPSNVNVMMEHPNILSILTDENQCVESVKKRHKTVHLTDDDDSNCVSGPDVLENDQTKEVDNKANEELMGKISLICKQLEKEFDDRNEEARKERGDEDKHMKNESNGNEETQNELNENKQKEFEGVNEILEKTANIQEKCNKQPGSSADIERLVERNVTEDIITPEATTPVKSILKKKKTQIGKEIKHVSFRLDKNNELINEVATFSLSKEPSQSLIGIEEVTGNLKSEKQSDLDSSPSAKLTVSRKKKVLMNLSQSGSETSRSYSKCVKKAHGRRNVSSSQDSKTQANKGNINNHAKIISEVLKKYPHLVKDTKKIHLKFLKKSNEKEGGKTKSKIQYMVLSDKDSTSKPLPEASKDTLITQTETNTPQETKTQLAYKCPECDGRVFQTFFTFKKHVTLEHQDKSSVILSQFENVPYTCFSCFAKEPLEFEDYFSYLHHLNVKHNKNEHEFCDVCRLKRGRTLELAYHQYIEHNKVSRRFSFPKCDLCDHVAINEAALLKHRSQHTNADNYTCPVCGVKFCSFGALHGHRKTRLCVTKPNVSHKCPFCPLTFARSYSLKVHCKSSHRSQKTSSLNMVTEKGSDPQNVLHQDEEIPLENKESNNALMNLLNSDYERNNTEAERYCETAIEQTSSEAEAMAPVPGSIVTCLATPERSMDESTLLQNKSNSNTLDKEKMKQDTSQTVCNGMHAESPPASEYENHPQCYQSINAETSSQGNATVNTLIPMQTMSSEVISNNVSEQVVPSHLMPGGPIVQGAASQGWTYVTYQVPTTSENLTVIMTSMTSINAPSINLDKAVNSEN